MAQVMSSAVATKNKLKREVKGAKFLKSEFFQPQPPPDGEYQEAVHAFLIEQEPNEIFKAHFHQVEQFQIVLAGEGKLGKHHVAPVSVHYTDPFMPYGPIESYDEGITYFTLRKQFDPGANFMPESRKMLKRGKKNRNKIAPQVHLSQKEELLDSHLASRDELLETQEDGLNIHVLRVGRNGSLQGISPQTGGGQYYININGSMQYDEETYPEWSCFYVSSDEEPFCVQAGTEGTEVLVLQFPQ